MAHQPQTVRRLQIKYIYSADPLEQNVCVLDDDGNGKIIGKISFQWDTNPDLIKELVDELNNRDIYLTEPIN